MKSPPRLRSVSCVVCGNAFETRHSRGKYCSETCAREGARKSWRDYAERNRPERQAYYRRHYGENADQVGERIKAYQKSPAGKLATRTNGIRQREKFPEKYAARQAVLVAVRSGALKRKPCEKCGATKVQAHHPDYSKPLEIVWLCEPCHRLEHAPIAEAAE